MNFNIRPKKPVIFLAQDAQTKLYFQDHNPAEPRLVDEPMKATIFEDWIEASGRLLSFMKETNDFSRPFHKVTIVRKDAEAVEKIMRDAITTSLFIFTDESDKNIFSTWTKFMMLFAKDFQMAQGDLSSEEYQNQVKYVADLAKRFAEE